MVTFTVLVQGYVISLGAISGHLPSVLIVEQKLEISKGLGTAVSE